MTIDPDTGETRTTTTRVDDVTGELYQTTVTRRPGGVGALGVGLGVLAVVAIVALVYMFMSSSNRASEAQARLDAQNAALATAALPSATPYPDPNLQAQVAAAQTQAAVAQVQAGAAADQAAQDRSAAAAERAAAAADRAAAERAREAAQAQPQPMQPSGDQTPQG